VTIAPYHIKIAPTAKRQILALPEKHQKIIIKFIETLAINPRPPGVKKIDGMIGLYSEEVNYSRLIYKVEELEVLLLLVK
jgi:mRNA interferase RelE/StbE